MCPDLGLDHKQCVTFFENEESMHREEIMEFTYRCNPHRPSRRSALSLPNNLREKGK